MSVTSHKCVVCGVQASAHRAPRGEDVEERRCRDVTWDAARVTPRDRVPHWAASLHGLELYVRF